MPTLVRFMLVHAAIGFCLAVVFVGALMIADVGGLRTLMIASGQGAVAISMLLFMSGLTFGGAQMGVAVMLLGEENNPQGGASQGRLGRIFKALLYDRKDHVTEKKHPTQHH